MERSLENLFTAYTKLFPCRFDTYTKHNSGKSWKSVSQWHHLSDSEIFDSLVGKTNFCRAIRRGEASRFAVLSVPSAALTQLQSLKLRLQSLKKASELRYHQYYFDESVYFYFFLSEVVDAELVDSLLSNWLEYDQQHSNDVRLVKVLSKDDAIPLPLQPGFEWHGDAGMILKERNSLGLEEALALFLVNSDSESMTFESLRTIFANQTVIALPAAKDRLESRESLSSNRLELTKAEHPEMKKSRKEKDFKTPVAQESEALSGQPRQHRKRLSRQARQNSEIGHQVAPVGHEISQLSLLPDLPTSDLRAPPG